MLGAQGIIPPTAAAAILPALLKFQNEFVRTNRLILK
jgi:hypothetical protein